MNSLIDSERDSYIEDYYFDGFLFSNSFSYVFDNSIWGSLGPVDGTASVSYTHLTLPTTPYV